MYYLSACNRGMFKSYYCYVLFLPFKKSFKFYEISFFNSISIYSWNRILLLTKIRKKCIIRKANLYFSKFSKMSKFFLQMFVIFNMITDSFLVEKCVTLERTRTYVCKNLLNLDYQNSVCFGIIKLLINGELLRKSFIFQQNVMIETSKVCFKIF